MLRLPVIAAALSMLVALPASSQAPISQGRTSATAQLQSSNAEIRLKVTDLEAENARLTGEVETLRFLLNQNREQMEQMQEDDAEIARQLKALNSKVGSLSRKVKSLEGGNAKSSTASSSGRYVTSSRPSNSRENAEANPAPSQTVRRTFSTNSSGPRNLNAGSSNRTVTPTDTKIVTSEVSAPSSSGGTVTRTVVTGDAAAQTGSLGTISASNLPGDAGPLFAEAKSRLTQFDHAGAEEAFRAFLDQFGEDPQAGEAQYWLGETLYQQGAYAEAGSAYTAMIQNYPEDLRAPDALVKLARAMRLVGESEKACVALSALPKRYPNASAVTKNLAAVEATRASCG